MAKRLIDVYFALFKVLVLNSLSLSYLKYYDDEWFVYLSSKSFQVLITDATSNQKLDKSGKGKGNAKEGKSKDLSESHVELDSRLLSVLLTVNMIIIYANNCELFYHVKFCCNLVFYLVLA